MTSPLTPNKYVGPGVYITCYVTRNRRPTTADYRQPETGRLYPLFAGWQVGKDPINGTEGELWFLSKIVANQATWIMLDNAVGDMQGLRGDDGVEVDPAPDGYIDLIGVTIGNGVNGQPVYTTSLAPFTEVIEVQVAAAVAPTPGTAVNVGLACFNNTQFTVDANGFVSLLGGGEAVDALGVQAVTGGGTDPVSPNIAGIIEIAGSVQPAGTNPLRSVSTAVDTVQIQSQFTQAIASTNATRVGLGAFDSAIFTVDANGFVSMATNPFIDLHTARYIVSAGGGADGANYTTIAAAITAAVLAGGVQTIFIQPGTYTENFNLPANINLAAFTSDGETPNVNIIGVITCSGAGTRCVSNIRVTSSGSCFIVTGAAATNLIVRDCYLSAAVGRILTANTTVLSNTTFYNCIASQDDVATNFFDLTTASNLGIFNCRFFSSSNVNSQIRNGCNVAIGWSTFVGPIETSGACTLGIGNSQVGAGVTSLTLAGTLAHIINYSSIGGPGAVTAITIAAGCILVIQKTLVLAQTAIAISGAGTIQYSDLTFSGNAFSTITVTTQSPITISNDAVKYTAPAAYPYTVLAQDAVVGVNTSSARTINLPPAPSVGEKHTVKDVVGSAGANNITVQGNGSNINGAASETIATNYAASTYVYTGTIWAKI